MAPTTAPSGPSVVPSSGRTSAPSSGRSSAPSSGYLSCSAYSASNTNDATINYSICSISACPGNTVTMTTFAPGSCTGDTYLRLYDPSTGLELAANDDYNGSLCSQITYTFTASCRTYQLREGCYSSGSCSGQVYYSGSSAAAQQLTQL